MPERYRDQSVKTKEKFNKTKTFLILLVLCFHLGKYYFCLASNHMYFFLYKIGFPVLDFTVY